MKILVACEMYGRVRDAFRAKGHDAISCDVQPDYRNSVYHIQDDVFNILGDNSWDVVIAFPPCTHLSASGARWWPEKRADGRQQDAVDFVKRLAGWGGPYAIENPVGWLSTAWRKPDQIIQPYWFGDPIKKTTCLWLNRLPTLTATNVVGHDSGAYIHRMSPGPNRARLRAQTFPGVANAMADQWGAL